MIRKKNKAKGKRIIDLTGPEGNAFVLMGIAKEYARQMRIDGNDVVREMMKGDYEELIKVFDEYFGDFVILER